jgi:hypothetical protein
MQESMSGSRAQRLMVSLSLVLALLSIVVVGCANGEPPSTSSTQPSATESTPSSTVSPPNTTPSTPTPPPPPPGDDSPAPGSIDWNPDGVVTVGEYLNQLNIGTYRLFWTSSGDSIRMAMQSSAQGWVAVGFQPGTRMKNADIVFGMMSNGVAIVLDSYSTGDFGPHTADDKQGGSNDIASYGGLRTETTTTFEFERKLDTGDALDVALQVGVPQQLIWAYGSSDGEKVGHSTRGYADITP